MNARFSCLPGARLQRFRRGGYFPDQNTTSSFPREAGHQHLIGRIQVAGYVLRTLHFPALPRLQTPPPVIRSRPRDLDEGTGVWRVPRLGEAGSCRESGLRFRVRRLKQKERWRENENRKEE